MNFASALREMVAGNCLGIRISKWQDDVVIRIQTPDTYSKMTAPYLYVESRHGKVPWIPTQIEMLTEVWAMVDMRIPNP